MSELHSGFSDEVHPRLVRLPLGQRPLPPEQEEVRHRPEYVDVSDRRRAAPSAISAHIHIDDEEEQRSQNEALDVAQVSVTVLVTVVKVVVSATSARPGAVSVAAHSPHATATRTLLATFDCHAGICPPAPAHYACTHCECALVATLLLLEAFPPLPREDADHLRAICNKHVKEHSIKDTNSYFIQK